MRILVKSLAAYAAGLLLSGGATATVITFQDDLPGFEAAAGGAVPTQLDFDSLATGTDVAGSPLGGITLNSPSGNTLEVVDGLSTFTPGGFSGVIDATTNRLFPTSGSNVLSPGGLALVPGADPAEADSLEILFAIPQLAVGFDVLFQSFDTGLNTTVQAFDASGNLLVSFSPTGTGPGGSPGGSKFIGLVSDDVSTNISRVLVTESDGNAIFPDSNVGYDTLRSTSIIPEPATSVLLGLGLSALAIRERGSARYRKA